MVLGILKTKDYRTFELCGNTFEGAQKANRGLPGDTLSDDCEVAIRADHKGLVGVLELAGKARYGFTARNLPIYLFSPWNESYPPFYVGSSHKDTTTNVLAIVDFENWEVGKNCPRGNCRDIIGPCGDLESEEKALLAQLHPKKWKNTPLLNSPIPPAQGGYKLEGNTFHIDPPGCRDIDDALTIWNTEEGATEVRIHIADVASTLATNPWLCDAQRQGQTIYKNGVVVAGMFPEAVEEKLSLLPGQSRMTLTLGFTFAYSKVSNIRWFQQEIQVKESYTYDTIILSQHHLVLREVAACLAGHDVIDPHDWVAEFMLFYNKQAANWLYDNCSGVLRRHSPPDMDRLKALEAAKTVPTHLAYSSGEYCEPTSRSTEHWGLGVDVYCHATSPIRRWVDCLNQAHLIDILFSQYVDIPLADIDNLNAMAKAIKKYERDLTFVRVLMGPNSVKEVAGIVVELHPSKMRVWVEAWKQLVIVKGSHDFLPGAKLDIKVFFDAGQRNWKRRMVLSVVL